MLVSEVMTGDVYTIGLSDSITEAARRMREGRVECLVVTRGGSVCGIISERDVALGCPVDGHIPWECPVYRHMAIQSVVAYPGMDTETASILLMDNDTSYLPVVEKGEVVGMVSLYDISKATEREDAYESEVLGVGVGAD